MCITNDAREVRGDYTEYKGANKTKTSNAAIQDAAYQVALATRAIVYEEFSLLNKARVSTDHPAPPWLSKAYVPVITTTARLFVIDFPSESTKLDSGEIDLHDATLAPAEIVLFEYPLPKHLQLSPADPLQTLKSGRSDVLSRLHIFVVRAEALAGFLRDLFSSPDQRPSK
jgi:hypothetical protein